MPSSVHRSRFGRDCVILALLTAALFLILFKPWSGDGYDPVFYYSYLSSPFFDGDLDVTNDYAQSNNSVGGVRIALSRIGPKGLVLNQFAIGPAVLWAPFFLPVRAAGVLLQTLGVGDTSWVGNRFSYPYLFAVSLGTVAYGYLALVLIYATCRSCFRRGPSLAAAAAIVFASPLLGYVYTFTAMSHAPSAFAVALLMFLSFRYRKFAGLSSYAFLGGAIALVTLVRWQDIIFGAIPAAFWLAHLAARGAQRSVKQEVAGLATGSAVALSLLSLQFCYWKATLGSFLTMPQGSGFMQWGKPALWQVLFSGYHGLFYWHPVTAAGMAGLLVMLAIRRLRWAAAVMLLLFLGCVYVNGAAADWYAGASFGGRRFSSALPLLGLGLAAFLASLKPRLRQVGYAACALLGVVNMIVLVAYDRMIIDAYFWGDFRRLSSISLMPALRALWALPLNGYVASRWILEENVTGAGAVAGTAIGFLFLLSRLLSRGAFRRAERHGGLLPASVSCGALVAGALMLFHAPPPDPLGQRFYEIAKKPDTDLSAWNLRGDILSLIRDGYRNPAVYIIDADTPGGPGLTSGTLEKVRALEPVLWARWVSGLSPSDPAAAPADRSAAKALLVEPPGNGYDICRLEMGRTFETNDLEKRSEWLARTLLINPFDDMALILSAQMAETSGSLSEAQNFRLRRVDYLKARVQNFRKFRRSISPFETMYFHFQMKRLVETMVDACLAAGLKREALFACKVYTESDREHPFPRIRQMVLRAELDGEQPDLREAISLLEHPTATASGYSDVGRVYAKFGDVRAAASILQHGFRRFPEDGGVAFEFGQVLLSPQADRGLIDELSSSSLKAPRFWALLGEAQLRHQRPAEAERDLRKALPVLAEDGFTNLLLAQAIAQQGRPAESLPHFEKAFRTLPNFAPTGRFYAQTLVQVGKRDQAMGVLEEARANNPADSDLLAARKALQAE